MVQGNIILYIVEYISNMSQFSRNENENPKANSSNFKKPSVLAQTITSVYNSADLKDIFFKKS